MPLNILGNEVSIMRIGARQLKMRGPKKKNKPLVVFKKKSVPSETPYILQAQLCLAKAAMDMRGHSFEEVVWHVQEKCSDQHYVPQSVINMREEAKRKQAEANVARMERKLHKLKVRGYAEEGKRLQSLESVTRI